MPAPQPRATVAAAREGASASWPGALLGIFAIFAALAWIGLAPDSAAGCGRMLHQSVVVPLVFSAAAAATLRIRGRRCALLSFAIVAGAFLLPLWWRWYSGTSDTMLVGGLLPFSDASVYLANAERLAGGGRFLADANNHPLATAMLAVLLKLTQGHYRLVLALISLLGAACAWIATAEISLLLGAGAGAAWLFVDILFLRRFVGIPMTEHLGVLLGSLAVALACRAVRLDREANWVWASLAWALALFARAGPMFVLPALIGGAFLAWPNRERRRWVLPAFMAAAMLAALALDKLVEESVGSPHYVGNAVYVLHGIVYGGTWKDAMRQYGNDRGAVWHAVGVQLLAHPLSLLSGGAKSILGFARQFYLFSFAGIRWLNVALHLLFAAGVASALVMLRRDRRAWWLLAPLAGLVASMPLLPPWDTDVMRIYAATVPLIGFTVAVGLHAMASAIRERGSARGSHGAGFQAAQSTALSVTAGVHLPALAIRLLFATAALCAILPPLLRLSAAPPASTLEEAYALSSPSAAFRYLPHSALHLVSDTAPRGATSIRLADFTGGLGDFAALYPGEAGLLAALPADCILLPRDGRFSFVAIDASHVPAAGGTVAATVRFQFLTQGILLLAADNALLGRSAALAAYHPGNIGSFSFSENRYPVIRAGDTVTYAPVITSMDLALPLSDRRAVNPSRPIILDIHRLNFPAPGEYFLRLNDRDMLRLLVLPRESTKSESDRVIADFVASNCTVESGEAPNLDGGISANLERLSTSGAAARMSETSMRELTALLQSTYTGASMP